MIKKSGNFLEDHVSKIVFAVIGIVSSWLLWAFVLSSPYSVEYRNQKCAPSEIDTEVKQLASVLAGKLGRDPEPRLYTNDKTAEFSALCDCSLKDVPDCPVILPISIDSVQKDGARKYRLPDIGAVTDVSAGHVRSVAHVPTELLGDEFSYSDVPTELSDIDFVTVQAAFDTVELYESFRQSFAGVRLKSQWHDEELAKPIFAAVELQRRQISEDSHPGEWEKVGPTKINAIAKLSELPQKISQLEYGDIDLKKAEFDKPDIQISILQPEPYDFAVSDERWLPPLLHKEYKRLLKNELEKEQKKIREQKKEELKRTRETAAGRQSGGGAGGRRLPQQPRQSRQSRLQDRQKEGRIRPDRDRAREKTSDAVVREARKLLITERTNLARLREPLVFWAHDDTVIAGKTYQYRIRLGVLNPIAGRNWFMEDQSHLSDELVLWSGYSEPSETISILRMMYFFPTEASAEDKTADIQVSKFHMGRWMSEKFSISPGQLIGNLVEKIPVAERDYVLTDMYLAGDDRIETIDYTTKAVLVDVVASSDFAGVNLLQQRAYTDILYTENGRDIEHLAAKSRNWLTHLRRVFSKIKEGQGREIKINEGRRKPFGSERDKTGDKSGRPGMLDGGSFRRMPGRPGMPLDR